MEEKQTVLRLMGDVDYLEEQMERCAVMSECRIDRGTIEACQEGDGEAFRLLFEAYKDRVYSIAFYFFSGDEASANDITQEIFLKLMTQVKLFRQEAEFSTWLYRVVANACLDEQRRRRRWISLGEASPGKTVIERRSLEDHYIRLEIADSVRAAIANLKPRLRITILLKYFEDLSYHEMANVLGCSMGTVASRLNRAHAILARRLSHLRGALLEGE